MVSLIGEGVYLARFLAKNDTPPFFSFCISIRDTVGPIRGSVHLLSLLSSHLVLLSRLSFRLVFVAIFSFELPKTTVMENWGHQYSIVII